MKKMKNLLDQKFYADHESGLTSSRAIVERPVITSTVHLLSGGRSAVQRPTPINGPAASDFARIGVAQVCCPSVYTTHPYVTASFK